MDKKGVKQYANTHAHHIVPVGDERSKEMLEILQSVGIDGDNAVNGVYLPANSKAEIHPDLKDAIPHLGPTLSQAYFDELEERFETLPPISDPPTAAETEAVVNLLRTIAYELVYGTYYD